MKAFKCAVSNYLTFWIVLSGYSVFDSRQYHDACRHMGPAGFAQTEVRQSSKQ